MDDQKQLPAPSEDGSPERLDVALRRTLQKGKFDLKILESVEALGKVGVKVSPNATPGYVLLLLMEVMHGRRAMLKQWEKTSKRLNTEKVSTERKIKKLIQELAESESDETEELDNLKSRLKFIERDFKEANLFVLNVGSKMGEIGKEVVQLHGKILAGSPPDGEGSLSWDPDAPKKEKTPKVEVHIHSAGPTNVELSEGEE